MNPTKSNRRKGKRNIKETQNIDENRLKKQIESENNNKNELRGYFIFKNEFCNKNLVKKPFYGYSIYDPTQMLTNEEIDNEDIIFDGKTPIEKFKHLSSRRKSLLLLDHEIWCNLIFKNIAWPFMSYNLDSIGFKVDGFSDYSHEEVRLAFYVSYSKSGELLKKYKLYMNKYKQEYIQNIDILLSNDFIQLISETKHNWSVKSLRLNEILSHFKVDFNSNTPLISQIDSECVYMNYSKVMRDLSINEEYNQWYTLPTYPYQHEISINKIDFKNANLITFPTFKHDFIQPYSLISDIFATQLGPQFYQMNSSTKSFDGAYNYIENVSNDDKMMFNQIEYLPGNIPLFPPPRSFIKQIDQNLHNKPIN